MAYAADHSTPRLPRLTMLMLGCGGLALSLLSACGDRPGGQTSTQAVTGQRIVAAAQDGANWLTHGRDYGETRHSPLVQITEANVSKLGLAWYHDLDTSRGQEATPLIVDGKMFTTSAWSKVQAFDAVSGKLLWQYDPEVPGTTAAKACCDVVNRGAAYWEGKLFVGTLDGRLLALNADSGKLIWSTVTVDQSKPYTITGAPRVVKGRVIIGNGGAELGVRGYVSAYDADSGEKLWRFYTVPGQPGKKDGEVSDSVLAKAATPTWSGRWWSDGGGGGGTVWDSMSYDPDLDLLYIGVGNASYWDQKRRSDGRGDNLFVASILALRPETGEYVWHYQQTPGDQWDYTSTQHMILADLQIGGAKRKVLMQAPKNGFFFVLDRATGKLLSADPYTPVNWAEGYDLSTGRPRIKPAALYSQRGSTWQALPGAPGGHNWQPMAYNPGAGLVYIPEQSIGFVYKSDASFKRQATGFNLGVDMNSDLPDDPAVKSQIRQSLTGNLIAWDPVRRRRVWTVKHDNAWNGGVLSTAGNLVFQGDSEGFFTAYNAKTGEKLWSFDCQSGIVAAPVTWSRDNVQYVTIVVGWGGAYPLFLGGLSWNKGAPVPNRSRILTFRLDGKSTLPAPPPATKRTLQLLNSPVDPALVQTGRLAYNRNCSVCHGGGAESGGIVPDLRYSAAIKDQQVWRSILVDGALSGQGMVSFRKELTDEQIEAVRLFVADRARVASTQGGK